MHRQQPFRLAAVPVAVAALGAALLFGGCSSTGAGPGVVDALAARHESGTGSRVFQDLSELTVNHLYQAGDRSPASLTEAVVLGRVSDVSAGRAFTVPGGDAPGGTLTDFGDDDAQWRTFHARVDVVETISGRLDGRPLVVGLALGPSARLETVRKDLLEMREIVLFLERSPVFGYDTSVYGIVGDGALLAPVDEAGNLSLPVLEATEQRSLLARGGTLDELRAAAQAAPVTIRLDPGTFAGPGG